MRPGLNIGQYTLVRYLGKGGMAEVWEARHCYLANKGRLAIKFLLPQFATNQELQERFLKEAQRQLEHPNIVSALDFFQVDGLSYMVMQYVPPPSLDNKPESLEEKPKSLEDRLEENHPLSVEEIHNISADVLSALDFAHSHGVVHRDVKPPNVLLHRDGRALLTDFGIAKGLREERSMTRVGTSLGTPDYMSPEQIREPQKVDARSDIYSFGCVLYAMLSRNPPFGSEETTEYDIKDSHVRVIPPPLVYWNPNVPTAVGEVVFKCLEKIPANRYQNCGAVMLALNAALTAKQSSPQSRPPVTAPLPARGEYHPTRVDIPGTPVPTTTPAPNRISTPIPSNPSIPSAPVTPVTPLPAEAQKSSSLWKFVAAGVVAVALIGGLVYAWQSSHSHEEDTQAIDFNKLPYGDSRLLNCNGDVNCLAAKAQADRLLVANWNTIPYNSPLFENCMGYPKCIDRKAHAEALPLVSNWSQAHIDDCMQYPACDQERLRREKVASAPGPAVNKTSRYVDPETLPSCCKDSPNPAQCKAQKKAAGIHGDCTLGH